MESPHDAVGRVLAALDRLEIGYLVGGSVASSIHGISRPTLDLDIVVDLKPEQVDDFAAALAPTFYADVEAMREALRLRRAFNVIHIPTSFKFDIFPLKDDTYSQTAFERRHYEFSMSFGPPIELFVACPEDTILRKLEWYRSGGETSERQWNDLRGVARVNRDRLDYEYLRQWAAHLHVDDLLETLLAE